ncbi:MAG: GDSL-type esterase/lipase family protein [Desulfarculales bacterium]|jgi:lysophospholipase L1-like esterase|nr:GDSL-type esterase/lipase family protein [Desulfarculales bacterium]
MFSSKKRLKQIIFSQLLIILLSVGLACAAAPEKAGILLYGDSLTWGFVPLENPSPPQRFPYEIRWPGVLQNQLGADFVVIEEGLNGRNAGVDDFSAAKSLDSSIQNDLNLNGRPTLLPIIRSHEPLALVLIMLGTNDIRPYNQQNLDSIKASVTHLIRIVKLGATRGVEPKILLVAPPPVTEGKSERMNSLFGGGYELARQLAPAYQAIAQSEKVEFFDAASIIPVADGIDGIHFTPEANARLGQALAARIKQILP